MKQKDWAMIAVVGIVSAMFSFFLSNLLFSTDEVRSQKVEVAPKISSELPEVDKDYFNDKSFNPAKDIKIGSDPNANPF